MQFSKNKKATTVALFLALTMAIAIFALPIANAHTPAWSIPTFAYVTASPSQWGIGSPSPLLLVFWLNVPPPTAAGTTGDRWQNMTIDITPPSGPVEHFGPFHSDPIGSSYMTYTPSQAGTYSVTFKFPGQTLSLAGYTGLNGGASVYVGDYYQPSQATTTFSVAESSVAYFQEAPLPVSYWTRPINENNQFWSAIASNWLGQNEFGATYLKFNPYGWAPNTAHVMWTYPLTWGGIVGGDNSVVPYMGFYSGTQYQLKFPNPIIMYGNVYFSLPLNNAPTGNGIACVSLRTGKTLWTNPNIPSVTFGQLYDFESPNQHGTTGNYLWYSGTATGVGIWNPNQTAINQYLGTTNFLGTTYPPGTDLGQVPVSGIPGPFGTINPFASTPVNAAGSLIAVDPQTGRLLLNLTNVPTGTRSYGSQGEWLIHNIGRENSTAPFTYLWQWNNTKLPGNDVPGGITQWIPGNTNWNMSAAYDWNVTLSQPLYPINTTIGAIGGFGGAVAYDPVTGLYTNNPGILRIFPGDKIFGQSSGMQQTPGTGAGYTGTPDPFTLWAINLNASRGAIGQVMWLKTYPAPANNITVCIGAGDANFATLYYKETMQWVGIDMRTGDKIWGPTAAETPAWNFYTGTTGLTNPIGVGYGHLYVGGYGGVLRAYDLKTGNIDFTYGNDPNDPRNSTYTPETAYGDYPTQVAAIADGKVYLVEEEHSLNAPAYHGGKTRCVNATTGELLWEMYGLSSWQEQAVADGYYVWFNLNDQQVYAIGPGPSSTSVAASPSVTAQGNSVLITGTVLDQSPNPDLMGTAAISDADQGPWMDYMVTKSAVRPADATGVTVLLQTLDPNGNFYDIGTVTSDSNGMFKLLWEPPVPGEYRIFATFAGSQSYGPSSAEIAIGVTEAPAATSAPTPPPAAMTDTYVIGFGTALIIIVVVIGAVLIFKRH